MVCTCAVMIANRDTDANSSYDDSSVVDLIQSRYGEHYRRHGRSVIISLYTYHSYVFNSFTEQHLYMMVMVSNVRSW